MTHKWTTPNELNKSVRQCEKCGCRKISNHKGFIGKTTYIDGAGNHFEFSPPCTGVKPITQL